MARAGRLPCMRGEQILQFGSKRTAVTPWPHGTGGARAVTNAFDLGWTQANRKEVPSHRLILSRNDSTR